MKSPKMMPRKIHALMLGLGMAMSFLPATSSLALTDLADVPVANSSADQIPPNILFVLDNSGSMAWAHMTNLAKDWRSDVGYKNHLCNGLYYNPGRTYDPPLNFDGEPFSGAQLPTFKAAWYNGYNTAESWDTSENESDGDNIYSSAPINLEDGFRAYDPLTGDESNSFDFAQRAYYYKWNGTVVANYDGEGDLDGNGSNDCNDDATYNNGDHTTGNWVKTKITEAEEQNFANWYSYYRTRMLLMKTAAGHAFTALDDKFRVGFMTICPSSGCTKVEEAYYLPMGEFDATQKQKWYEKFYAQIGTSNTPLRRALSRAGRYYANKTDGINEGISDDPIQYSCQRNYTILTTDGNWNSSEGVKLDGSSMDDQDNDLALTPRPMFDGGPVSTVVSTTTIRRRTESRSSGSPSTCPSGQRRARERQEQRISTVTTTQDGDVNAPTPPSYQGITPWVNICTTLSFASLPHNLILSTNNATTYEIGEDNSEGKTLADVAEYYYRTDLREDESIGAKGFDVGTGGPGRDVPSSGSQPEDDNAPHQHMTTFTLGMGVSGHLKFDPYYKTATSGIFQDIRDGKKGWPKTTPSNNMGDEDDQLARIDDLWHAAVNGRGTAFSAGDADTLKASLETALQSIQAVQGSAAAAATSTLTPTEADNLIFLPSYTTGKWIGDLEALPFNIDDKSIGSAAWSAQTKLETLVKAKCDNRVIKLFRSGVTDNLVNFAWNTSACGTDGQPTGSPGTGLNPAEQGFFSETQVNLLNQPFTDGTSGSVNQITLAKGANLVNFIRGQRAFEGFEPNHETRFYRAREKVMGDIVHSQPVHVGASKLKYPDNEYPTFRTDTAGRDAMVYVGGNDGMLHAFEVGTEASSYADGGNEKWAFIPSALLPRLYKLADMLWPTKHEYYVDARPVVADIFDGSNWKTILVGGLGKGGRAYYALDITDPNAPKGLWEFNHDKSFCYAGTGEHNTDCHLGYSFSVPIIGKLQPKDGETYGRWVVIVTSGYNNVNAPWDKDADGDIDDADDTAGDGYGYLYVLDAATGHILQKISTGQGAKDNPSGLSNTRDWTTADDVSVDPTISLVYGADLLGNIFRFDINAETPTAELVTTLTDGTNPQPVTARLSLAKIGNYSQPYIFVATGRYLGSEDIEDKQVQSVYAIKDTGSFIADVRDTFVKMQITNTSTVTAQTTENTRTIACVSACESSLGWFIDLPDEGERVNVDPQVQLGTLYVASSVPLATACAPGGYGWFNAIDLVSGQSPEGPGQPMGDYQDAMLVGFTIVDADKNGDGEPDGDPTNITVDTKKNIDTDNLRYPSSGDSNRISWREIVK